MITKDNTTILSGLDVAILEHESAMKDWQTAAIKILDRARECRKCGEPIEEGEKCEREF